MEQIIIYQVQHLLKKFTILSGLFTFILALNNIK